MPDAGSASSGHSPWLEVGSVGCVGHFSPPTAEPCTQQVATVVQIVRMFSVAQCLKVTRTAEDTLVKYRSFVKDKENLRHLHSC